MKCCAEIHQQHAHDGCSPILHFLRCLALAEPVPSSACLAKSWLLNLRLSKSCHILVGGDVLGWYQRLSPIVPLWLTCDITTVCYCSGTAQRRSKLLPHIESTYRRVATAAEFLTSEGCHCGCPRDLVLCGRRGPHSTQPPRHPYGVIYIILNHWNNAVGATWDPTSEKHFIRNVTTKWKK